MDEALIVRLEFQNILRIDHLWMLKSLRKLTLAHNLIEKIENLEQLTGLNELDLSFNKIEKIEIKRRKKYKRIEKKKLKNRELRRTR